jgi:hypothetical protein
MLKRNLALFLFLACVLVAGRAFAAPPAPTAPADKDVLVFNNGDQLSGTFEGSTGGNLKFKSDMAGEITVGWDKVKELRTSGHFAVLEKGFKLKGGRKLDSTKIPQGTLTVADQSLIVKSDAGFTTTVPAKDADFVLDSKSFEKDVHGKTGLLAGWNGGVTGGVTLVKATQDSQTYGKVTQPGTEDIKSSIFHADAEHDIYFSPKAYALANVSFDHNYSQGLSLQSIYGGGIGLTVKKDPKQELDVKAQAQYEMQTFFIVPPATTATGNQNLIAATIAENYVRKLKLLTLNEQLQYVPAFNDTHDYSGVGTVGAVFPVYKRFSLTANVVDTYLNDATVGSKRNSFQFVTGVNYKFR